MSKKSKKGFDFFSYVTKGNVFDDLGFSKEKTATLKLKFDLHHELLKVIVNKKLKPRDLEKILDQPQPRISDLLNGKIHSVSVEKLTSYLHKLGFEVSIKTTKIEKFAA